MTKDEALKIARIQLSDNVYQLKERQSEMAELVQEALDKGLDKLATYRKEDILELEESIRLNTQALEILKRI